MTSTSSPRINWPILIVGSLALLVASPFLFAFAVVGLALTVGLVGKLLKLGLAALAIWAVVMLFKAIFGSPRPTPTLTRIQAAPRFDPDAEAEREKRESLAALDRELARALAEKNDPRL